jgi:hypothetical protein
MTSNHTPCAPVIKRLSLALTQHQYGYATENIDQHTRGIKKGIGLQIKKVSVSSRTFWGYQTAIE